MTYTDRNHKYGLFQEDVPEAELAYRWVSVEERLPPDRVRVPVLYVTFPSFTACHEEDERWLGLAAVYDGVWKGVTHARVTHWLPPPPRPEGLHIIF